jgi:hypothetical protein
MRVTLTKHGGLAAGIRRPPRVVEADALTPEAAEKLARLVASAKAAPSAGGSGPGRARDAMGYTISVEDGGQSTLLRQSDANMSPAFAALLEWLERLSEAK